MQTPADALTLRAKGQPGENTTIAIVATDAVLTKAQAKQFAVIAQDWAARAIYPVHTTLDGDTVFAAATGRRPLADAVNELTELGALAANVLAGAVARGVYEATALPFTGAMSWKGTVSAAEPCPSPRVDTECQSMRRTCRARSRYP